MGLIAKLVTATLRTRVIVDENATDEQISKAAEAGILHRIHNGEMYENSDIEDDKECPVTEDEVYYQPEINDSGDMVGHEFDTIYSFQVWRKKENLLKDFPNCNPIAYAKGDIEDPTFMD